MLRPWLLPAADRLYAWRARHWSYAFDPGRYGGTLIAAPPADWTDDHAPLPRRIFTLWTGDNELTPNRSRGLDSIRALNPAIDVVVVTPHNLADFVRPGAPLHPAYQHLSFVHRSDYLRAYLMHHHGGGYADLKTYFHPWEEFFEALERRPDRWVIGYPEIASDKTARLKGRLGRDIRRHYRIVAGQAAYVMRPGSPFTREWLAEVERLLDEHAEALAAAPGNAYGDNPGYPIRWEAICANVLAPLGLKYHDRLLLDVRMRPHLHLYR